MIKSRAFLPLLLGVGLLAANAAQADIPVPESCTNIVAVALGTQPPYSNEQGTGVDAQLSRELAKQAGIKINLLPVDSYEEGLRAFASGQVDMWLSARLDLLEHADALLLEPAYWQARYQLWFRYAELADLKQTPALRGLRAVYWPAQIEQGLLTPWLGEMDVQQGLEVANQREAVQAILNGKADFLLADGYELDLSLQALAAQDELEALAQVRVTESVYIALSNNSACNDPALQGKLSQALRELNKRSVAKKLLQKKQASLKP